MTRDETLVFNYLKALALAGKKTISKSRNASIQAEIVSFLEKRADSIKEEGNPERIIVESCKKLADKKFVIE